MHYDDNFQTDNGQIKQRQKNQNSTHNEQHKYFPPKWANKISDIIYYRSLNDEDRISMQKMAPSEQNNLVYTSFFDLFGRFVYFNVFFILAFMAMSFLQFNFKNYPLYFVFFWFFSDICLHEFIIRRSSGFIQGEVTSHYYKKLLLHPYRVYFTLMLLVQLFFIAVLFGLFKYGVIILSFSSFLLEIFSKHTIYLQIRDFYIVSLIYALAIILIMIVRYFADKKAEENKTMLKNSRDYYSGEFSPYEIAEQQIKETK